VVALSLPLLLQLPLVSIAGADAEVPIVDAAATVVASVGCSAIVIAAAAASV
jgi:hypothetical protein